MAAEVWAEVQVAWAAGHLGKKMIPFDRAILSNSISEAVFILFVIHG